MQMNGRSEELPHFDRPLLVPVKRCSPQLKGTDHLLNHLVKEQAGQLRVQERLELKGHLQRTKEGDKLVS